MCEGDFAPDVIDWENREAGRQLPSENLCHPRHFWQRLRLRTILCGSRPTDSASLHPGLRRRAEARWDRVSGRGGASARFSGKTEAAEPPARV